ncbi:hypothetical protein [Actinokineospora pegani]|uniref:hypothetical protein n=1 Tax=Actinokineospora pegani TaxID=2654637 RepID=UPI0012EA72FE|nr:hypothetical protein [Actinokineospora pegani]
MENDDNTQRPEKTPWGVAEDVESIAILGRKFTKFVTNTDSWHFSVASQMPVLCLPEATLRRPEEDVNWDEHRKIYLHNPIRMLISTDVLELEPESVVTELYSLSETSSFQISACQGDIAELWPQIRQFELNRAVNAEYAGLFIKSRAAETQVGISLKSLAETAGSIAHTSSLEQIYDALLLHRAANNMRSELFVSSLPEFLEVRSDGFRTLPGVVSPKEAIRLCYAIMRSRREYVTHLSPGQRFTADTHTFYGTLSSTILPKSMQTLRHCLRPGSEKRNQVVARHLQTIIARFSDLLISADELHHLKVMEGLFGGNNNSLTEQIYHLSASVLNYCGILESLAWLAKEVDEYTENRGKMSISWGRLVGDKGSDFGARLQADGRIVRDAARRQPSEWLQFVLDLRAVMQHRRPLEGGVLEVRERSGQRCRANFSVIDLPSSCSDAALIPLAVLGPNNDGLVQPSFLQHEMVKSLSPIIEATVGSLEWRSVEWLTRNQSNKQEIEYLTKIGRIHAAQWLWPIPESR